MPDKVYCSVCKAEITRRFFQCDQAEGSWCEYCFSETPCGEGEHGEGCQTVVFDDAA